MVSYEALGYQKVNWSLAIRLIDLLPSVTAYITSRLSYGSRVPES